MADEQVLDFTGLDHLIKTTCEHLNGKAPDNHASTNTTYGVSTASKYGHAKASGTTPKAPGTATVGSETSSFSRGDHVHPEQVSAHGIKTAGSGAAYTATVEGITALTAGASFIMIPHTVSTSTAPTLNVNGLGAKTIRRTLSDNSTTTVASELADWLGANKPVRVTYNGTYWIADLSRPKASDIYGPVGLEHGGHGGETLAEAQANLGIITLEELPNLYIWQKYTPTKSDTAALLGVFMTASCSVDYADSFAVTEDGVSLVDEQTLEVSSSFDDEDLEILLGKYSITSTGKLFFIHSDSGFKTKTSGSGTGLHTNLYATRVTHITDGTVAGYVASKTTDTYPSPGEYTDGYWYKYHKQLGE